MNASPLVALANVFPLLVVVAAIGLAFVVYRTVSRISGGSAGAGPFSATAPAPAGLRPVSWLVERIDQDLERDPGVVADRLVRIAGERQISLEYRHLPPRASVEAIVSQLESAMDLSPIDSNARTTEGELTR